MTRVAAGQAASLRDARSRVRQDAGRPEARPAGWPELAGAGPWTGRRAPARKPSAGQGREIRAVRLPERPGPGLEVVVRMRPTAAVRCLVLALACTPGCDELDEEEDAPTVAERLDASDDVVEAGAFSNRTECYAAAARVRCGGNRLALELGCPSIHVYPCDLGAYFDCVEDQVRCTADELDTSSVPTCLPLLSCE